MFDWQTVVVMLLTAAAAGWVAWQVRRGWRAPAESGCGSGCSTCSLAAKSDDVPPAAVFVPLENVLRTVESHTP